METNILELLKERFIKYQHIYPNVKWEDVVNVIDSNALKTLSYMEETGEVAFLKFENNEYQFFDICGQSPKRRALCYDENARLNRKKFPPLQSVELVCKENNLQLLDENEYYFLQKHFEIDTKTSSWIKTPQNIREKDGALFCDRRYDHVFTYHNKADSYYESRGFRAKYTIKI